MVDAGHGGTDPGAVGPMGAAMPESTIVLAQAELITRQLEALGANVVRIRETDTFYTLQQRVDINRAIKPDMFISLHTNATAETTNATNIRGFTVWFRNENSRPAATTFMDNMYNINPATNRNRAPSQANFFVCRPMWSPAVLLEASFTNNIHDFSWMINPRRQEEYARAVVNTLLAYYR
jgi:N-acetylmuramoyl-L-alanine amidase